MLFKFNRSNFDFAVIGLGNPGPKYEGTRHNAGFAVIDAFLKKHPCPSLKRKFEGECGECNLSGKRILVIKPQTFMNNSGRCVSAACAYYKIPVEKIIVVFDDISLDVGNIRLRRKGSAGGHNGIKDIIELLGSEDIMRIKVGVGAKPHPDYDLASWVLGKIPAESKKDFERAVENASCAIEDIVLKGMDFAMNRFSK